MKLSNPKTTTLQLDTGTPFGIGYWSEVCPRRSVLYNLHGGNTGTVPMQTGSVAHALLAEHFLNHIVNTDNIRFNPQPDPVAERDGIAAFRAWRGRFPSISHFGKPVAVEYLVDLGEDCEESFGVPYTCRVDLVTEVSRSISKALIELYHLPRTAITPGRWLVDHKYHGSDWKFTHEPYREGLQAPGYQLAHYWETGEQPAGMIFNHVFKGGDSQITVCPPPDREHTEMFIQWLIGAKRKRDATMGWANSAACWYPSPCPFRLNGKCKGA